MGLIQSCREKSCRIAPPIHPYRRARRAAAWNNANLSILSPSLIMWPRVELLLKLEFQQPCSKCSSLTCFTMDVPFKTIKQLLIMLWVKRIFFKAPRLPWRLERAARKISEIFILSIMASHHIFCESEVERTCGYKPICLTCLCKTQFTTTWKKKFYGNVSNKPAEVCCCLLITAIWFHL